MSGAWHIDCFTAGLDDLKRKEQRDIKVVARVLAREGRFSVFEATANPVIAGTMVRIEQSGWFEFDNSCGYPWMKVTLTEAGKAALEVQP
jgi:hypothetical protein